MAELKRQNQKYLEMSNYFQTITIADNNKTIKLSDTSHRIYMSYPYEWIQNEILSFQFLEENWDGYGGIPVDQHIVDNAQQFICMVNDTLIDKISDVFPNPNGTITLEWQ